MGLFDRIFKRKSSGSDQNSKKDNGDWEQLQYRNDDGTWTNTSTMEADKVYRTVYFKDGLYTFSEIEVL